MLIDHPEAKIELEYLKRSIESGKLREENFWSLATVGIVKAREEREKDKGIENLKKS